MIQPLTKKLEYHELAKIFPYPNKTQRNILKDNIRLSGLLDPIVLFEGKILDGRNRHEICLELGIEPRFTEDLLGLNALEFITSKNLARRNLTPSQLAAVGADIVDLRAKEFWNKKRSGKTDHPKGRSGTVVARQLGVGEATIKHALSVKRQRPDLFEKIKTGEIKAETAFRVMKGKVIGNDRCEKYQDKIAAKINEDFDLIDYKGPPATYASDYEIWIFDKYLKRKGYSLSLSRVGDNFQAVYVKDSSMKIDDFCNNYKTAIIMAGKAALAKEEEESKKQLKLKI